MGKVGAHGAIATAHSSAKAADQIANNAANSATKKGLPLSTLKHNLRDANGAVAKAEGDVATAKAKAAEKAAAKKKAAGVVKAAPKKKAAKKAAPKKAAPKAKPAKKAGKAAKKMAALVSAEKKILSANKHTKREYLLLPEHGAEKALKAMEKEDVQMRI